MPTLKQIECSVELGSRNIKLKEYGAIYRDGYVEVFLAVPDTDIQFTIHIQTKGYIAPGLAFFVFMDGEYQCNRNRVGLKLPGDRVDPGEYETEFRMRQKEDKKDDGSFVAREWSFAKMKTASADKAPRLNPQFLKNVGTIEVVALRCKPAIEGSPPRRYKSIPQTDGPGEDSAAAEAAPPTNDFPRADVPSSTAAFAQRSLLSDAIAEERELQPLSYPPSAAPPCSLVHAYLRDRGANNSTLSQLERDHIPEAPWSATGGLTDIRLMRIRTITLARLHPDRDFEPARDRLLLFQTQLLEDPYLHTTYNDSSDYQKRKLRYEYFRNRVARMAWFLVEADKIDQVCVFLDEDKELVNRIEKVFEEAEACSSGFGINIDSDVRVKRVFEEYRKRRAARETQLRISPPFHVGSYHPPPSPNRFGGRALRDTDDDEVYNPTRTIAPAATTATVPAQPTTVMPAPTPFRIPDLPHLTTPAPPASLIAPAAATSTTAPAPTMPSLPRNDSEETLVGTPPTSFGLDGAADTPDGGRTVRFAPSPEVYEDGSPRQPHTPILHGQRQRLQGYQGPYAMMDPNQFGNMGPRPVFEPGYDPMSGTMKTPPSPYMHVPMQMPAPPFFQMPVHQSPFHTAPGAGHATAGPMPSQKPPHATRTAWPQTEHFRSAQPAFKRGESTKLDHKDGMSDEMFDRCWGSNPPVRKEEDSESDATAVQDKDGATAARHKGDDKKTAEDEAKAKAETKKAYREAKFAHFDDGSGVSNPHFWKQQRKDDEKKREERRKQGRSSDTTTSSQRSDHSSDKVQRPNDEPMRLTVADQLANQGAQRNYNGGHGYGAYANYNAGGGFGPHANYNAVGGFGTHANYNAGHGYGALPNHFGGHGGFAYGAPVNYNGQWITPVMQQGNVPPPAYAPNTPMTPPKEKAGWVETNEQQNIHGGWGAPAAHHKSTNDDGKGAQGAQQEGNDDKPGSQHTYEHWPENGNNDKQASQHTYEHWPEKDNASYWDTVDPNKNQAGGWANDGSNEKKKNGSSGFQEVGSGWVKDGKWDTNASKDKKSDRSNGSGNNGGWDNQRSKDSKKNNAKGWDDTPRWGGSGGGSQGSKKNDANGWGDNNSWGKGGPQSSKKKDGDGWNGGSWNNDNGNGNDWGAQQQGNGGWGGSQSSKKSDTHGWGGAQQDATPGGWEDMGAGQVNNDGGWGKVNSKKSGGSGGSQKRDQGGRDDRGWGGSISDRRSERSSRTSRASEGSTIIKPYWKDWNMPFSKEEGSEMGSTVYREPLPVYTYPANPLPAVPSGRVKDTTHAVQTGKGADYAHLCRRPTYIDTMEAPYAVFSFKYRTKEVVEDILRCKVHDSAAEKAETAAEEDRLLRLPKKKLVAEVMGKRGASQGS